MNEPTLADDPYSAEHLADPYPLHARMRSAGPFVYLPSRQVWASASYQPVRAVLSDPENFCSSAGVGLANFRTETPWRPPSLILEADPPDHTRTRGVLAEILSSRAVADLEPGFTAFAETLVDELIDRGDVDAVTDLAAAYTVRVFGDAVGLAETGREHLLPYGDMVFNAFGPQNDLYQAAMDQAEPVRDWIMAQCTRAALRPDSLGAQIFEAADSGVLTEDEAGMLMRSFLSAGLDTTVLGIANALYCFVRYPEQYARLVADPDLAGNAFEETVRFESPAQVFYRTTTTAVSVLGTDFRPDQKVMLCLAGANRDPERWERADEFDITRRAAGHVGFGFGIHMCVGNAVARLEAARLLKTLARRVKAIEPAGEPVRRLNNTVRGLASLPVVLVPA